MKGTQLGEFEELVLLTVAVLFDNAYGVAVQKEIKERTGRKVTISTVHVALKRLEKKGFAQSRYSDATPQRGGRKKLLFHVTMAGKNALEINRELRNNLWNDISTTAFV